jgi:dTDP-4-amino-4,6-dideoxygalactose transaminase
MEQLNGFLENKRELANRYKNFFKQFNVQFVAEIEHAKANYWLNSILLSNEHERDLFLKETNENGVMTRPVWDLMNTLPMFKDCQCDDLENSQWIAERLVNIPSSVRK